MLPNTTIILMNIFMCVTSLFILVTFITRALQALKYSNERRKYKEEEVINSFREINTRLDFYSENLGKMNTRIYELEESKYDDENNRKRSVK